MRCVFEFVDLFWRCIETGMRKYNLNLCNFPGIGTHDFHHFRGHTRHVYLLPIGYDSHGGEHATAECGTHEVRRAEGLPFSLVIYRGIGDNHLP